VMQRIVVLSVVLLSFGSAEAVKKCSTHSDCDYRGCSDRPGVVDNWGCGAEIENFNYHPDSFSKATSGCMYWYDSNPGGFKCPDKPVESWVCLSSTDCDYDGCNDSPFWGCGAEVEWETYDEGCIKFANSSDHWGTPCPDPPDACPGGTYGSKGNCTPCPPGSAARKRTGGCIVCGPGTYSKGGQEYCEKCEVGKYSVASGATEEATCLPCPVILWLVVCAFSTFFGIFCEMTRV